VLENRSRVRPSAYVEDMADDLLVVPAGGEFGLAGLADSVPVAAATARLAVEDVRGPLRADVDVLRPRPVLGVHRIPPGAICLGRPKHLVVLLATARLNRLGPPRGNLPLGPGDIIIGPV
jgi:hypothetical protein